MTKIIFFAFFIFIMLRSGAQSTLGETNPLLVQLAKVKSDSVRLDLLIQIADDYLLKIALEDRLDSVEFYLTKARQLNTIQRRTASQNIIAIIHAKASCDRYPDADPRTLFLPAIDSCKKTGDLVSEQRAWHEFGQKFGANPQLSSYKLSCFETSVRLAKQLHNKDAEMDAFRNIADVHITQGELDQAEKELFQILNEEKNLPPSQIMYTYDLLTELYMNKKEYDKALSYGFKTLRKMEDIGDSILAYNFYYKLYAVYTQLNRPAEALEWQKKALSSAWANYPTQVFATINIIANQLLKEGKAQEALKFIGQQLTKRKPTKVDDKIFIQRALGDCYLALKQDDAAEKSYTEVIRLASDPTFNYVPVERGNNNYILGSINYRRKNYQKARQYLEQALKDFEEFGGLAYINSMHLWLSRTDSLLGDYPAAMRHLQKSNQLMDSVHASMTNKQIEELQIAYGTEQKNKDLMFLEEKGKLDRVKLQHSESTRNWVIAGASMLLIIAGLLYRLTLIRKRNNRIINNKNNQLQHLVTEKEWLLKEVHHRVKNNLHTVIGLLESQAAYLEDDALKANELSKHRIYSMSLIHQQLYKAEDIKTIDMSVYLPELIDYLGESFGTARTIRFQLNIEPIKLGVSQAIPIALIVNEAVTNSIKYAFPTGNPGTISVSMHQAPDKVTLEISDDGIGIDPAILDMASASLGMKLMNGLTDDIDGHIRFINEKGTKITISFAPDPVNEHAALLEHK